jgi:hypothetical protein
MPIEKKPYSYFPPFLRHLLFLFFPPIPSAFTIFSAVQRASWANANANMLNKADAGPDPDRLLLWVGMGWNAQREMKQTLWERRTKRL